MAEMILGVGTGVILIALIWIVAFVLSLLLSRTTGATKLGIIPVLLLALITTLILVFFPRASEVPSPVKEVEIVDKFFIGRYVLLTVASLVFLVTLFMLLPLHFLEPVYAKPLKTR